MRIDTTPLTGRHRRGAIAVAAAIGGWLLPWSAVLGASLPSQTTAYHWSAAWVGLDLAEAASAAATAILLARHDDRAALTAAVLATLLCVDAWFDVCTAAPGGARAVALAEALGLELPLAAAAGHLSLRLMGRRSALPPTPTPTPTATATAPTTVPAIAVPAPAPALPRPVATRSGGPSRR